MNSNNPYILPDDLALSNFVKALALPVRICIVRYIIENGNAVKREQLAEIPYNLLTVNQHVNELKHLGILNSQTQNREITYSVNEPVFIKMSKYFLNLFEPIRQNVQEVSSTPKVKKPLVKKPATQMLPFGQYVRQRRKAAGLSQAELAERIQMDRALISKLETNKHPVRAEKLCVLAEALNAPLTELRQLYYQNKINELTLESLRD
ncbi:helix-turn-helix domain-containing protein [Mucilaginibacter ximonensis]|uniref:Helix-turn-helix domain-containing protein n=1 Tax=Mucilaginibacter ximonensis TaxID=538021 RepID=A0ABW5YE40_9SPHI